MQHDWVPSRLGHGETMCRNCAVTNREAAVLGMAECPVTPDQSERPKQVVEPSRGKPILLCDFDGVIHLYSSGWKGADVIPDPPVDGALSWLHGALQYFDTMIYSSRSRQKGGIEAMRAWFTHWAEVQLSPEDAVELMDNLQFPMQKPAAFLTIDDRAICFDGVWSELDPKALLDFKPWNKRELGATGEFPDGKANPDDDGLLKMRIGKNDDVIWLEFGKRIASLGFDQGSAIDLARNLLEKAGVAFTISAGSA